MSVFMDAAIALLVIIAGVFLFIFVPVAAIMYLLFTIVFPETYCGLTEEEWAERNQEHKVGE